MADTLELVLELADRVSGPAAKAAAALARIDAQAQKAQQSAQRMADKLAGQQAAQVEKIQASLFKANEKAAGARVKALQVEQRETRKLGLAQLAAAKINSQVDKARQASSWQSRLQNFAQGGSSHQGAGVDAHAVFAGSLAANLATSIIGSFVSGAERAVSLVTDGVKGAFVQGGKAEDLRLSYKHLLGAQGGKEALDDIGRFSGKTKFDDDKIAELMRPLFQAGLKGTGARTAFALAADANVRTGADPSELIAGLAKIQLKGGVTEKLITGLGVEVSEFKAALSEETGIKDKEAAFEKAEKGKLNPISIQNAIVRATEKHFGTKTGKAANEGADTMSTRLAKLADLPNQYLKKVSDSPEWVTLSNKFAEVLQNLSPDGPRGQKIIGSLMGAFDKLSKGIENAFTPENINKFVDGISHAVDIAGQLLGKIDKIASWVADPSGQLAKEIHPGDKSDVSLKVIDSMRRDGTMSGDKLKERIAALSPSERDDLSRLPASGGMDYTDLLAQTAKAKPTSQGTPPRPNIDMSGMTIEIHAAPGDDVHDMSEAAGASFQKFLVSAAESASQEGG